MAFELATGDLLFCPKKGDKYDKTDGVALVGVTQLFIVFVIDHLALMVELLGKMSRSFLNAGSNTEKYFNSKGELRYIKKLGPQWSLADVLYEKYHNFFLYIWLFLT